ncbi:phosphoribosyltransferase [Abyssisolibacter fermentans]|uniref:phosphoribosyltransferase n=1 Tax=Abyssisolibacter fermentans TaxID=1766203 RepID=UPI000A431731|nr:phosphoribosyltransferase family protein [Abyssisolibacter fermentans]
MFIDRKDAGNKLALKLAKFKDNDNMLILAVPRGGIVIAYETIKKFKFKWDLIIPRKIGSPQNEEVAIGAVTSDGTYLLNNEYVDILSLSQEYIEKKVYEQTNEIKRRLIKYKGNEKFPQVKDKIVVIIDDGIATGFTILAAIKSIKKHGVKKIILAIQ